jgi:hypothetical protein
MAAAFCGNTAASINHGRSDMIYTFTCIRDGIRSTHDIDLSCDLFARREADKNSACLKVETASGRVVWRKPLTDAEFREAMTGTRRVRT